MDDLDKAEKQQSIVLRMAAVSVISVFAVGGIVFAGAYYLLKSFEFSTPRDTASVFGILAIVIMIKVVQEANAGDEDRKRKNRKA